MSSVIPFPSLPSANFHFYVLHIMVFMVCVCDVMCVCVWHIHTFMLALLSLCEQPRGGGHLLIIILYLISVGKDLLLNLQLRWHPSGPSQPPVFTLHSVWITGMCISIQY